MREIPPHLVGEVLAASPRQFSHLVGGIGSGDYNPPAAIPPTPGAQMGGVGGWFPVHKGGCAPTSLIALHGYIMERIFARPSRLTCLLAKEA